MGILRLDTRHQSTKDAARWLDINPDLEGPAMVVSRAFAELTATVLAQAQDCPELTVALRELTCAQDNVRRAIIANAADRRAGWAALRP